MKRITFTLTLACMLVPVTVGAQTLVYSQNKCKLDKLAEIQAFADSAWIPIAQELVNDGALIGVGSAFHHWGDEWNVVYWYVAEDVPGFLDGFAQLYARSEERYPGSAELFMGWCFEHKDSFYRMGRMTSTPPQQ